MVILLAPKTLFLVSVVGRLYSESILTMQLMLCVEHRACPGQKWAEHLLFIAMASMIAAFKFETEFKDGVPIPPNDTYDEGFVWHLGPSECRISARSEAMASLIRHTENF